MTDRFLGMLGLARRAGKTVLGYDNILKQKSKCVIVVCASDMSDRTRKNVDALGIKTINTAYTKQQLGSALGAEEVAAAAVTDRNFASALDNE